MLEKLLLVCLFVTFEVTQLICHNMTCCNPEIRIYVLSLLAWTEMATTVMNGNDCFKNGNDCFKWQRPFAKGKIAMALSIFVHGNFCFVFGNFQQTEIAVTLLGHGGKK